MARSVTSPHNRAFLIERFGEFLALEQGSSARTTEAYARDLTRLADWCVGKRIGAPGEATPADLRAFVYYLKDLGLAPSSIRRSISAIRTYYKFLVGEHAVAADPSLKLETPKRWRTLPEVLSADNVRKLIESVSIDEPLAFRDRAMLELGYGGGLRVSEWIGISVQDLMMDDGVIRVFGKGAKERLVPDRPLGDWGRRHVSPRVAPTPRARRGEGPALPQCPRSAAQSNGRMADSA